jgi:hypothetical protein
MLVILNEVKDLCNLREVHRSFGAKSAPQDDKAEALLLYAHLDAGAFRQTSIRQFHCAIAHDAFEFLL